MKHLLILISILLLSSPVIGSSHKFYRFDSSLDSRSSLSIINYGETLYGWGEYPDYIWKEYGDKETHPKYKGGVENGVPNGLGYLIYPYGSRYLGSWKNAKINGQGTFPENGVAITPILASSAVTRLSLSCMLNCVTFRPKNCLRETSL